VSRSAARHLRRRTTLLPGSGTSASPYSRSSRTGTSPARSCPLSLHAALPISLLATAAANTLAKQLRTRAVRSPATSRAAAGDRTDRKSTRLNSSHRTISYAVFCLKKQTEPGAHQPEQQRNQQRQRERERGRAL